GPNPERAAPRGTAHDSPLDLGAPLGSILKHDFEPQELREREQPVEREPGGVRFEDREAALADAELLCQLGLPGSATLASAPKNLAHLGGGGDGLAHGTVHLQDE